LDKKQRAAVLSVFNQDIKNSRKLRDTKDSKLAQHFTDKANRYMEVYQPSHQAQDPITVEDVLGQLQWID